MEKEEQDELARLEALASVVSDSSESEESGEDSDTIKLENEVETVGNKTEELDLGISENNTILNCTEDNTFDAIIDTSASTVSVTLPAGVSCESIVMTDSQMDKVVAMPSMASLQDIFNSIESSNDMTRKSIDESGVEVNEEVKEHVETVPATQDTVGEYNQLRDEGGEGELFSDYPMDIINNVELDPPAFVTEEGEDGSPEIEEDPDDEETMEDYVEEDSESSSSDEEMPPDFSSLSELCVNYMDHLSNMLGTLQGELERNLRRQQEIEEQVCELNSAQATRAITVKNQHVSVSKKALSVFGFPYFKDQTLYHPPPNRDTLTKRMNKELDVWIEFPKPFTKEDRKKLKGYVREEAIGSKTVRVCDEKEVIEHQINSIGVRDEEKAELAEKIRDCDFRIREVENMPDDKLFLDRFHKYDWDKISVTNFQVSHHPRDCQLQWQNLVHPSINRSVWSPGEDRMLKRLADATSGQDWDAIAREMESGRTPHSCFVRYMTRHNVAVNNRKWERSEDDRLRRLVAHCRINDFIPWSKVSYYMDRRTKDQCYQRFVYSLKDSIRKGTFTDAEDMILIIGEKLYGNDWAKICEMLPCRTPIQIHCRFNSFIKCEFKAWTQEEDLALLELVRKHGLRDWVVIANEMEGQWTRAQVRQRFQLIYKNFKKNPAMALDNIEYNDDAGIAKKRQEEVFDKLSKRFEEWKEAEEGTCGGVTGGQSSRYGQMTGRSCGHILLPHGEVVNNRDLTRFIRYIQTFLPPPEPPRPLAPLEKCSLRTLPEHREEIFKRPVVVGRNLSSKVRRGGLRARRGGHRGRGRKVKNRDRLGSQNFKTKLDRDIAKFFRPTWISKGKLGHASRYSDKELELLVAAGQGLGSILKLDKVKWDQNTSSSSVPDKQMQLLQSFRYQQLYRQPSPQLQLSAGAKQVTSPFRGPSVQRTYGRTYSRAKVKQSLSRSNTPVEASLTSTQQKKTKSVDTINLVPPSQATVVGFRGVLLRNQYLRDSNNCSDTIRQERDVVDNTIMLGVNNPDLAEVEIESDHRTGDSDHTAAHLAADRLLVSRFIQLFLWPAKMSAVAPPKQENLFSDSEDDQIIEIVEPCVDPTIIPSNVENVVSQVSSGKDSADLEIVRKSSEELLEEGGDTPSKRRKIATNAVQDLEQ